MKFRHYDEQALGQYNESIEADFAESLIARWGMVAAIPDGEDSQGRSRLRLQTPQELIDRAFEVARIFMVRLESEGHLRDLGPLLERRIMKDSFGSYELVPVKAKSMEEDFAAKRSETK
jgi:hypothetical protein